MNDAATMLDSHRLPNGDIHEELAAAARRASTWDVAFRPVNPGAFPERVRARRNELLKLEAEVAALPPAPANADPRMAALLDVRNNPRLVRSGISAVTLKTQDLEKLPRVIAANRQDEPRAASVCRLYLASVRGQFSVATLIAFLRA